MFCPLFKYERFSQIGVQLPMLWAKNSRMFFLLTVYITCIYNLHGLYTLYTLCPPNGKKERSVCDIKTEIMYLVI